MFDYHILLGQEHEIYFIGKVCSNSRNNNFEFPLLETIEVRFSAVTDERQQY